MKFGWGRLRRPIWRASRFPQALLTLTLASGLAGCESTQEKSARIEHAAKRVTLAQQGLSIKRQSTVVKVLSAAVVHDGERDAAVVTLRNDSAKALRDVPLAIAVKSAIGQTLFENNSAGLEAALTSVGSLAAHGTVSWVNDQVSASGTPASATAKVGEAPVLSGAPPRISVSGLHAIQDPSGGAGVAGTLTNRSQVTQTNLVVFVLAHRGGVLVAAGRAVLSSLGPGASGSFQAFTVGNPHGAQLQADAPASSF